MSPGPNSGGGSVDTVSFYINGESYTVGKDSEGLEPESRLVDFIREKAGLTGTKYMCREGGCGACVVSVKSPNPVTGEMSTKAINSCLTPVLSCDGWDISTVEKLGNHKTGYHKIQQRLVNLGGTQCGFCSPGMVMNMYRKKGLKSKEIENNFDGNICRCTGYRPILDAFKSLSSDATEELRKKCADIEDAVGCGSCPLKGNNPAVDDNDFVDLSCCTEVDSDLHLTLQSGKEWVKVQSLTKAFAALDAFKQKGVSARLVAGNTGAGVYKTDAEDFAAFVDISRVQELRSVTIAEGNVVIGGGITLAGAMEAFRKASLISGFTYMKGLNKHISRIANYPVRNLGTLAGNLMLKHAHRDFPSDLFTIFETVGAQVSIASSTTDINMHTLSEFLSQNMDNQILVSFHFKPYTTQHILRTFKITRRYQNAHAYVNGGFLFRVDPTNAFKVLERPRIVFGGISGTFIHAKDTEVFLVGKSLDDEAVLKMACQKLADEVDPDSKIGEGSKEYRKLLPQSLLYKVFINILGNHVTERVRSGGQSIKRNVTSGKQTYETDESSWPINKPVLKLESTPQVSGEAEFINDVEKQRGELFGAFVVSSVPRGNVKSIDTTEALKIPGVVRFLQASDIPGKNNYMVGYGTPDEIFASNRIIYSGQPIGLIVAETKEAAFKASKKVHIEYEKVETGLFSISEGIQVAQAEGTYETLLLETIKSSTVATEAPKRVIKGEFGQGGQYHFQMETQICICIPKEDGLDVLSATQCMDSTQLAIASCLQIPNNEINIEVRRLGGAYGSKISRCNHVATACAVAAHVLNRPVRVALDLQTNMEVIGKRPSYLIKYEVGVDDLGKISSLKGQVFCDVGATANEEKAQEGISFFQSLYQAVGWQLTPANIITTTPPNTWCRAPGSVPGIAMVETIMEHIAFELKKDPLEVKMVNMMTIGDKLISVGGSETSIEGENLIPKIIQELKTSSEYEKRIKLLENFNKDNRWRKRGMALVPMRYPLEYFADICYPVFVAIYKHDGSVVVSHGGIEVGQGINTKVAQAVAFEFGIPVEKVKVKPSNNLVSPNTSVTGGSITSEVCCYAALQACKDLKARMAPTKESFKPKTWEELVKLCSKQNVALTAQYMPSPNDGLKTYDIWVANLTEVEIDVLTGEYKIVRVDLVEDAGKSLNPAIDIGQVEGALVMGIGHWTTEKLIYDRQTGRLVTNGTWFYKPPLPRDIPEDMRITFLKDAPNPFGILRSKATGEPPQCSAVAVLFALKNAIYSARKEAGEDKWFRLDGPVTPEDVLLNCLTADNLFLI